MTSLVGDPSEPDSPEEAGHFDLIVSLSRATPI